MAVIAGVLDEVERRMLGAVCDTFAPAVDAPEDASAVEREFFARAASDLGVPAEIEELLSAMPPRQVNGLVELLDSLADEDFAEQPLEARTEALHRLAERGPEAKLGVKSLRQLTLAFFYGLPDDTGRNPNWDALGYPGPRSEPPSPTEAPKTIPIEQPSGERATLTADVCVVGSGAGGGVVAAELQRAGRSVVVLEMGPYRNEADFDQRELPGMLDMYLGGGLLTSDNGAIALLAGSCLGGGTTINYQNCLRTPDSIRREWARMGVEGIDEPGYEVHFDAVLRRIQAGKDATTQNRTHRKLIEALEAERLPWDVITRNAAPDLEDPIASGLGFVGDQSGAKQGTLKTFLQDAADAGARFVVGARAERILVEDGRAVGVEAFVNHADGSTTELTVDAPTVVVAGGSIESPALLLRSGIGGPAVGRHLRLQPAGIVLGGYEEPIEGWEGQIQSAVSHAFKDLEGDFGFLIESTYMAPSLFLSAYPWVDGRQHKEDASRQFRHLAPFITVQRDHGEGEVTIDDDGQAVVRWSLDDEVDRRLFIRANLELCRLHRAAGAKYIFTYHTELSRWEAGEDFGAFLECVERASYDANDVAVFSAHQLGSCRMGADANTSVADGFGQLHDIRGVWIGDASAFPTASGVNPMVSNMALAHRTAANILAGE
jgi:choline dehydrogenase-like flavoprotein